jgi:hypothetical protein
VNSNSGNIIVFGKKGTGGDSAVSMWQSTIITGGNAGIYISGVISNTTSGGGTAVTLEYTDTLSTSNGPIVITAVSNSSDSLFAFKSGGADNKIIANGTGGSITITGNLTNVNNTSGTGFSLLGNMSTTGGAILINSDRVSIDTTASVNATSTGNVTIQPTKANRSISIGGSDSSSTLGIDQSEFNKITAANLSIGNTATSNISLSSSVSWTSNIFLYAGNSIAGTLSNGNRTLTQGSYTLTTTTGVIFTGATQKTLTASGVQFVSDSGFQNSGSVYTASGSVFVGYILRPVLIKTFSNSLILLESSRIWILIATQGGAHELVYCRTHKRRARDCSSGTPIASES